jgi:hypothetical protein
MSSLHFPSSADPSCKGWSQNSVALRRKWSNSRSLLLCSIADVTYLRNGSEGTRQMVRLGFDNHSIHPIKKVSILSKKYPSYQKSIHPIKKKKLR